MDLREVPAEDHGSDPIASSTPPNRRRVSLDEDFMYQRIMTTPPRPSQPPPYQQDPLSPSSPQLPTTSARESSLDAFNQRDDTTPGDAVVERLPHYTNSIALEGVFTMKHEIENTTKRAVDRQWRTVFVTLTGTALNIHQAKKAWSWGKSRESGPSIDPDCPPWIKKSKLEKSYSLLYADAGIAADYKKRRYVIRVRAETDQFLLCCIELGTFVKWLQGFFAAIDVAAPLEDRDFPRDMSIPRIQRLRWFRGESPTPITVDLSELNLQETTTEDGETQLRRRPSTSSAASLPMDPQEEELEPNTEAQIPTRIAPIRRMSVSSYPNMAIDPSSGKWFPEHCWSSAHDMLYAKLCYSNLLFRSPRKSNYIISEGKRWYVEWSTGRMVRVLPPEYGEINDFFGPWQTVTTDNSRI